MWAVIRVIIIMVTDVTCHKYCLRVKCHNASQIASLTKENMEEGETCRYSFSLLLILTFTHQIVSEVWRQLFIEAA